LLAAGGLPALIAMRAAQAASLLAARSGVETLGSPLLPPHPPGLTWRNWLFALPGVRRAHVELFAVAGQMSVLHVCLMPALTHAEPIFGLDLIGGRAVATGVFLDLSPTLPGDTLAEARRILSAPGPGAFGTERPRPDWGTIFSPDFICVRPASLDAAAAALDHGLAVLRAYLDGMEAAPARISAIEPVREAQRAYCLGQRANQHTRRMLAGFVGGAAADAFIETVLFPVPDA
jgi:hypothetical protein